MSSGEPGTKQKILEAARALIDERGGGYVGLSDIGSLAGVSRQAVYLHFRSRGQLLAELADYADAQEDLAGKTKWVLGAGSPAALLDRISQFHAAYRPRVAAIADALDSAALEDASLAEVWQARLGQRRELAAAAVASIVRAGKLTARWRPDDAVDFVTAVTSFRTWHELIAACGWSADQYASTISRTLRDSLLEDDARELVDEVEVAGDDGD